MILGTRYLLENPGSSYIGEFRLRDYQTHVSRTGRPYGKGVLEDAGGEVAAYWWKEGDPLLWEDRGVVFAEGESRRFGDRVLVNLGSLEDRVIEGPDRGARLVPHNLAHDPEVLLGCVEAIETVTTPALQAFCDNAFTDLRFAGRFFAVPASKDHHHAFPGGLAAHSLAVAKMASEQAGLNAVERDLALVGGLFHDVGKTLTCDPGRPHPVYLDHDLLALELLSRPLAELDQANPGLADRLRYILTWKRAEPRQPPRTPSAIAVRNADRQSAAAASDDE